MNNDKPQSVQSSGKIFKVYTIDPNFPVCKSDYPYVPDSDQHLCPVCGHLGLVHRHAYGVSYCRACAVDCPNLQPDGTCNLESTLSGYPPCCWPQCRFGKPKEEKECE